MLHSNNGFIIIFCSIMTYSLEKWKWHKNFMSKKFILHLMLQSFKHHTVQITLNSPSRKQFQYRVRMLSCVKPTPPCWASWERTRHVSCRFFKSYFLVSYFFYVLLKTCFWHALILHNFSSSSLFLFKFTACLDCY